MLFFELVQQVIATDDGSRQKIEEKRRIGYNTSRIIPTCLILQKLFERKNVKNYFEAIEKNCEGGPGHEILEQVARGAEGPEVEIFLVKYVLGNIIDPKNDCHIPIEIPLILQQWQSFLRTNPESKKERHAQNIATLMW